MKQRIRDLENSPERKAEFEANLAALPEYGQNEDDAPGIVGFGRPRGWRVFSGLLRLILRLLSR